LTVEIRSMLQKHLKARIRLEIGIEIGLEFNQSEERKSQV